MSIGLYTVKFIARHKYQYRIYDKSTTLLGSEMIGNFNIKTKTFEFEERVLIGWLANTVRQPANQDAYLKVQQFCPLSGMVTHD